ncbi:pyridoxamine 5'-phosphate oxidase family protein [Streptomyces sp. NBC_01352]|uniref:helix-turn-helix domain-containing protein n=1 Tax=unclassified Streptomyces TaxID=2593676 RepID=UPI00225908C5|nr:MULTISPECIES: pyridoxamine 5'-phosphate oxidase family protein [unclassified Streptomyces]MCX4706097.1 pyridoxamine 5'-phosphate oxidase family protein [Streptomyces sp. NBC_01373]
MFDQASPQTNARTGRARGDLGRRLVRRRAELGLTLRAAADRAGMAPSYLRYLENTPTAAPGQGSLLRLAGALETSVTELTGGNLDLPPGLGQAARHPELVALSAEECRRRLARHGVGRLAVITDEGPTVLPVNYGVVDGTIAFRTAPGSAHAQVLGSRVAFEVDHIDEALSRGWSVLVRGRARAVTDPDTVRRLADQVHSAPWAGGRRDLWVCVDPVEITGREIGEGSSGGGG